MAQLMKTISKKEQVYHDLANERLEKMAAAHATLTSPYRDG